MSGDRRSGVERIVVVWGLVQLDWSTMVTPRRGGFLLAYACARRSDLLIDESLKDYEWCAEKAWDEATSSADERQLRRSLSGARKARIRLLPDNLDKSGLSNPRIFSNEPRTSSNGCASDETVEGVAQIAKAREDLELRQV
jgi:hypothetical protein